METSPTNVNSIIGRCFSVKKASTAAFHESWNSGQFFLLPNSMIVNGVKNSSSDRYALEGREKIGQSLNFRLAGTSRSAGAIADTVAALWQPSRNYHDIYQS